jgi:molecular chaperone DnaK
MKNYVGIDLGTSNSAICSFDGTATRIWKSPEQNDVTPSVIYLDRRGNKYVGQRAYDSAAHSPDNAAMLFKRLMGTSTPIQLSAVGLTWSPEECSAEVLKVLFGYLPEEVRNAADTGTVITVPAAFNQMQKGATMDAAGMAGVGKVAIMQEPVAAVMSAVRVRRADGIFLIYDFGGGTLDVAVAESIGRRVNLLAHHGIAMCGGRDFDRALVETVVRPWLLENFSLPEDFAASTGFRSLARLAAWAAERAKIELSSREEAKVSLGETEARVRDLSGKEVYLDVPLSREVLDQIIAPRVDESIGAAREALAKAGLKPSDIERVVFVGGPTNYKPLRDRVASALGVPGSTEVNPMTAVAEGAALFAESVDWTSESRARKSPRGQVSSGGPLGLTFAYTARTPDVKARVVAQIAGRLADGSEFQIDSIDTGWTSGRIRLRPGATVDLSLPKAGENTFKVFVFDPVGAPITLEQDRITIARTAATVDAIPASHSIGVEVLERLGGRPVLEFIVRAGDPLPKKGKALFTAGESLKAGAPSSLNFKLWEGEIDDPIAHNRSIGVLKVSGADFDDGVIAAGADLECSYEVLDSGNVFLEVSVPSIGITVGLGRNLYSRQEGQLDFTKASAHVAQEGERTLTRVDEISKSVDDPRLEQARRKLGAAVSLDPQETETEKAQEAMDSVVEARRLLAQVRKEHLKEIRQLDLDSVASFFAEHARRLARPSEVTAFENLTKTAQRSIDRNDRDFEHHLDELKGKNFDILWRQDWFVVERFRWMVRSPHLFADARQLQDLSARGVQLMRSDDIGGLRSVVAQLSEIRIGGGLDDEMADVANIVRK